MIIRADARSIPYYSEAGIVIYHGDCREVLPTVTGADVVLTDPPYGISANSHRTGLQFHIANDDGSVDDLITQIHDRWPCVVFAAPMRPFGGNWEALLVWDKGPGVGGNGAINLWKRTWELIQVDLKGRGTIDGPRDPAVLRYWIGPWHRTGYEDQVHPTTKPLALISYLIARTSRPHETMLDPFMGSGTTLRAAKDLGRKAIGIELNERYCEISAKRLSQEVLAL